MPASYGENLSETNRPFCLVKNAEPAAVVQIWNDVEDVSNGLK